MTLYRYSFEGQTSGVTPTAANADDFGDPTYGTAVSITGSAVCTYSNAHPMVGTMGMLVSAASTEVVTLRSPTFTATDKLAFQEYIYLTAYPSSSFALAQWRTSGGNQLAANMDTSGRMYLVDNSGSSPVTLLRTAVIPLNTAYRYDAFATIGSTNANSSFKHKLTKVSDNSTLDEQTASGTLNLNNTAATAAMLVTGQHGKPNSAGAVSGLYIDSPAWSSGATDYMTAPSTALAVTGAFVPSSGTSPLAGTLTLTPSGGTGTTITYVIQWGDGSSDTTTTSTTPTHTYSSPGTYTWTATATNA